MHQLGPDLAYDKSLREGAQERSNAAGEVVFSPMLFKAADLSQELTQSEIPLSSLLGLGEIATKVKARFSHASMQASAQDPSDYTRAASAEEPRRIQLTRRYDRAACPRRRLATASDAHEMRETVGHKTIRKHQLSAAEIESIIAAG